MKIFNQSFIGRFSCVMIASFQGIFCLFVLDWDGKGGCFHFPLLFDGDNPNVNSLSAGYVSLEMPQSICLRERGIERLPRNEVLIALHCKAPLQGTTKRYLGKISTNHYYIS